MAKQSVAWAGGKPIQIPVDSLMLHRDHPEGQNKIQDIYKSELFVMESQHQYPNVYTITPLVARVWCEMLTNINCLT